MEERVRPECEKDWPKIYVKTDVEPKTLKELLPLLFCRFVIGPITYYKGSETYKDKECKEIQCPHNRYRSFDDIYACCKTYFPTVTPKEVLYELLIMEAPKYDDKGGTFFIRLSYCSTIKRIRVWYTSLPAHEIEEAAIHSGYSFWNWEILLGMLGLSRNYAEIYDYIKKEKLKNKTDGN